MNPSYIPPRKSKSKIECWSEKIWADKTGIPISIVFNFIIMIYFTRSSVFSSFFLTLFLFIAFIASHKLIFKDKEPEKSKSKDKKEYKQENTNFITIYFDSTEEKIVLALELYIIHVLGKYLSDLFFVWIIGNLCIFYYPLNLYFPDCIFNCYLIVTQTLEGIIGLIIAVIPKFGEK